MSAHAAPLSMPTTRPRVARIVVAGLAITTTRTTTTTPWRMRLGVSD